MELAIPGGQLSRAWCCGASDRSAGAPGHLPGEADRRRQVADAAARREGIRCTRPDADLQQQFDLALQIRDKVSEANNAVDPDPKIKETVKDRLGKSPDAQLKAAATG